jgi:hypothetical protein
MEKKFKERFASGGGDLSITNAKNLQKQFKLFLARRGDK